MDEKLWAYEKQKGEAGEKKEMNKLGQRCSKKQHLLHWFILMAIFMGSLEGGGRTKS